MRPPDRTSSGPTGTRPGGGARRRGRTLLGASVVVFLVAATQPVGAQTDPAGDPVPSTAPTTTPTTVPGTTSSSTTAPPAGGTSRRTASDPAPASPVRLDPVSIDQLLAEARIRAQQARDAEVAVVVARVAEAQASLDVATTDLAAAEALERTAASITVDRERAVGAFRRQLGVLAADAYMRVGTARDDTLSRLRVGTGGQDPGYVEAQQTRVYADHAVAATRSDLSDAERSLSGATEAERAAEATVQERRGVVDTRTATVTELRSAEAELRSRPLDPEVEANVVSLFDATGPTILGTSLVTAEDLAAFARANGRAHPSVDVEALAVHFTDEGAAEGVRADLAWVQSLLETGWFSFTGSMVEPGDHNYAGIGACDSCTRGYIFATPQLGARAQIQLLRTYADATATAATLARPPASRAPEKVYVRGCCATWMSLAGVWATNRQYGIKILTLYDQLLRSTVERRQQAAPPAPVPVAP